MSKKVSSVGTLAAHYTLEGIKVVRKGYLSIFSFGMDGHAFRFEVLDRGKNAAVVLPVDWKRRVLYLVQQPRPNKALVGETGRKVLAVVASSPHAQSDIFVSGESVHTIDAPAGMIDGKESPEAAAVREVGEETGFVITPSFLTKVAEHFVSTGCSTEKHICFLADVDATTPFIPPPGDGNERMITLEVPFDEAFAMLNDFTCEHASLAVLLREVKIRELETRLQRTRL